MSAYLGAASIISSKEVLNAAAAITVAEGLHQAVQRASILDVVSANIAGTPLSPNAVFTIASAFIQSCPSTNAALPFTAFPALTLVGATAAAAAASTPVPVNSVVTLAVSTSSGNSSITLPSTIFVTFISGLSTVSVPGQIVNGNSNGNGSAPAAVAIAATIPAQAQGQTYALLTRTAVNGSAPLLDDSAVIAGPAIMEVTPSAPTIDFGLL